MRHAALLVALLVAAGANLADARTGSFGTGLRRRAMLGASAASPGPSTWEIKWGVAYGEHGM